LPGTATVTFPDTDCSNLDVSGVTVHAEFAYTPLMFSAIPGYANGNLSSVSVIDVSKWNIPATHKEPWIGE
jgi:hypothetical protein